MLNLTYGLTLFRLIFNTWGFVRLYQNGTAQKSLCEI
jgi:hypothetical protein